MLNFSEEQVRTEVARWWQAFLARSSETLDEFYAPLATVFSSDGHRTEPGHLAVMRRRREYFQPQCVFRVSLGPVEVQMLEDAAAVASYTFRLQATRMAGMLGRTQEETIDHGRATQVFARDGEGNLRIIHEHFSVAAV